MSGVVSLVRRHRVRTLALPAAALLAALTLTGCGSASSGAGVPVRIATPEPSTPFRATVLDDPLPKPSVPLTATDGRSVTLSTDTDGKLLALYVGYTHCPDVCPTTMADLAVAVRGLPAEEQHRVEVVMITSDPARDTRARLRSWLDAFDPSFVGLTGPYTSVQKAATQVGIPIEPPVRQPDGSYVVDHGAEVLLFSPRTGDAQLVFTSGFAAQDVAHDMTLLLEGTNP